MIFWNIWMQVLLCDAEVTELGPYKPQPRTADNISTLIFYYFFFTLKYYSKFSSSLNNNM